MIVTFNLVEVTKDPVESGNNFIIDEIGGDDTPPVKISAKRLTVTNDFPNPPRTIVTSGFSQNPTPASVAPAAPSQAGTHRGFEGPVHFSTMAMPASYNTEERDVARHLATNRMSTAFWNLGVEQGLDDDDISGDSRFETERYHE